MKKLFTLLTILCFGLLAQAQIPSYVPTNGLVGWWPFNGNANDESGNGNHGTVNGATFAADRFGNTGKAYSFDGVDDYIDFFSGTQTSLNLTGNFSFSFWIKTQITIGGSKTLFSFGDQINFNSGGITIGINDGNSINRQPPHGRLGYATQGVWSNSQMAFNDFKWHNVIISLDNSNIKLFIDGVLENLTANQPQPLSWAGGRRIGAANYSFTGFFNGLLDDIAIYNRALSASEVQQLYLGNSTLNASVTSSVPGKINYQGMAIGTQRKPIKNGSIGLRFSVIDSSPVGAVLFTETLQVNTDSFGIFATQIGGGTTTLGKFENIPWSNGKNKFLKVEMDILGGSNYQTMGTNQLVSVPYALHAGSAEVAKSAMGIQDSLGNHYQISMVNGQLTLVPAPGSTSNPVTFACGQSVTYAGESYPTVQIGTQCWFQKNLNVGSMILGANDQTNNSVLEKYCYNNDTANCSIYGGLYQWAEAVQYQNGASNTTSPSPAFSGNVKGVCPTGWHVPSDGEWCTLTVFLDSTVVCGLLNSFTGTVVGGKMKSTSSLWNSPNTGATNNNGFSALPGGYGDLFGSYANLGSTIFYWSTYETTSQGAINYHLDNFRANIRRGSINKPFRFSVRCLKD